MVFEELQFLVAQPTMRTEDNMACQLLAYHVGSHSRTKHIAEKYRFIRERIQQRSVRIDYLPTSNYVANIFTKALAREPFLEFLEMFGVLKSSKKFIKASTKD